MLFLNPWLLAGLAAATIPVIIHLIRKQAAKPYDWGAMQFLFDTVAARRKRMEWEDLLLMVARCLLIALIVLAVARPFVPPDTGIPWLFVLPLGLLGIGALGGSFVLSGAGIRWGMRLVALVLALGAGFLIWQEKNLNLSRFQTSERRDVALVIDGSTSMLLEQGGRSAFSRAVEEAQIFVKEAPRGTAFSVVLGGPAPELITATPLSQRADVLEVLEKLEPVGGPFRAHEALGMATLSLAQGQGSTRDVVVFTDLQRIGWQFDSPTSWTNLGEAWDGMPEQERPRLLVRGFAPPEKLRNVAVAAIELSREVVGTDREAVIRVRIENTGSEMVTPGLLRVTAGRTELEPKGMGQLEPGEEVVLDFSHRFAEVGPQIIRATLEGNDDLEGDDLAENAIWVKENLPVLIVEGNSGDSFFRRAGGYIALALAPVGLGEESFVTPRVIDAAALTREKLDQDAVVILADVARLPSSAASDLADFVLKGGGLWIVAGPKTEPKFYNDWLGGDGAVSPLKISEMVAAPEGIQAAPASFDHPVLRLFKEAAGDDLASGVVEGFRGVEEIREGARDIARFNNGEIFLATRVYGKGRVILSTTALDARLGNLPARPSFVPLVHEITNWLSGGQEVDLNVRASWSPSLALPGGGGLRAEYRPTEGSGGGVSRIDPVIDFDWKNKSPIKGLPSEQFNVIWNGTLSVPISGEYTFEARVDDSLEVTVNGEIVLSAETDRGKAEKIELIAGQLNSFEARYDEEWGDAYAELSWVRPDGVREIVPSSAFSAISAEEGKLVLAEGSARDPRGRDRTLETVLGRRGKMLEVGGAALPGEYLLQIPEKTRGDLEGFEKVPLVVTREAGESRFEGWNDDDRQLIRRETDLIELGSIDDVLSALRGEGFGREIWKVLAIAALCLFFLEAILARWVSKSRRAGEEVRVDFEKRDEIPEEFLKSVAKTKAKGGSA